MSDFKFYRDRLGVSGATMQESLVNSTKRQNQNYILNSPSKSDVRLNEEVETQPCIVSNKESFNKRLFLFLPDTDIKIGDYIHHDTFTYLATDRNRNEIYPELLGELCNETYKIEKSSRHIVGYDDMKRPIYDTIDASINLPCVMTTKTYSLVDNSPIPLPDGAMIVKLPYIETSIPKVNETFHHRDAQFKVTTISYENVINNVGVIEVRLQREVNNNGY